MRGKLAFYYVVVLVMIGASKAASILILLVSPLSNPSPSQREVIARHQVRLRIIGRKELLPEDVRIAVEKVEGMTKDNTG